MRGGGEGVVGSPFAPPQTTGHAGFTTTTVLLDTATTLKVRDNVLLGTPPARFLRVKVTAAP